MHNHESQGEKGNFRESATREELCNCGNMRLPAPYLPRCLARLCPAVRAPLRPVVGRCRTCLDPGGPPAESSNSEARRCRSKWWRRRRQNAPDTGNLPARTPHPASRGNTRRWPAPPAPSVQQAGAAAEAALPAPPAAAKAGPATWHHEAGGRPGGEPRRLLPPDSEAPSTTQAACPSSGCLD